MQEKENVGVYMSNDLNDEGKEGQSEMNVVPKDAPSVGPKPGYKTTSGQLTIFIGLLAALLSVSGIWKGATPEKVENIYQVINNLIEAIGPLLAFVPVLITYINSRGKIQSNAMMATTALNTDARMIGGFGGKLGQILSGVTTGIKIGKAVGIPGTKQADNVLATLSGDEERFERIEQSIERINEKLGIRD